MIDLVLYQRGGRDAEDLRPLLLIRDVPDEISRTTLREALTLHPLGQRILGSYTNTGFAAPLTFLKPGEELPVLMPRLNWSEVSREFVRYTIKVPGDLHRRMSLRARREGKTFVALVNELLVAGMAAS